MALASPGVLDVNAWWGDPLECLTAAPICHQMGSVLSTGGQAPSTLFGKTAILQTKCPCICPPPKMNRTAAAEVCKHAGPWPVIPYRLYHSCCTACLYHQDCSSHTAHP